VITLCWVDEVDMGYGFILLFIETFRSRVLKIPISSQKEKQSLEVEGLSSNLPSFCQDPGGSGSLR
jgi:hypothetical protein